MLIFSSRVENDATERKSRGLRAEGEKAECSGPEPGGRMFQTGWRGPRCQCPEMSGERGLQRARWTQQPGSLGDVNMNCVNGIMGAEVKQETVEE